MKGFFKSLNPPKKERFASNGTRIDAQLREIIAIVQNTLENDIHKYGSKIRETGDINVKDEDGYTLFMRAIIYSRDDLFEILLDYFGTDINVKTNNGLTPLMIAVVHSKPKFVYELANHADIQINAQSNTGTTAIMLSIDPEITKALLLNPDIDLDIANDEGKSIWDMYDETCDENDLNIEILKLLKQYKKKIYILN